jgi:hypothetical protein
MTEDDRDPDDRDLSLDAWPIDSEQDGVASLHDTEAEAGDEGELHDLFDVDEREARELGVDLDEADPDEPRLD